MILGIGFIMVAAMFPVAIRQTEATNRETIAASIGRSATEYLKQVAAIPWPPSAPANLTTTSLLVPTLPTAPVLGSINIPAGSSRLVLPGMVWSMYDKTHDTITYTPSPALPAPAPTTFTHNAFLWQSVVNNLIQPGDARFGWVAMYRRDWIAYGPAGSPATSLSPAPFAQIIVIAVQSRNKQVYDGSPISASNPTNDIPNPPTATATTPFVPQYCSAAAMSPPTAAGGASTITFNTTQAGAGAAAENAYVVISNCYTNSAYNGRVYRIGVSRPDLVKTPNTTVWALVPGEDMVVTDPALSVDVFVVGRGADPNNAGQFIGPAQDVSVFSTYVPTN